MRFETWVPLISRRVKTKFSHKKSAPLPPKFGLIWLNSIGIHLCQAPRILPRSHCIWLHSAWWPIARNTVLRAACDAHSTSPTSQCTIHSPRLLPSNQDPPLYISPGWSKIYRVWYQWEAFNAMRVLTGDDRWPRMTTGDSGWQRVITGDDGRERVTSGSNVWRRAITGDNKW